MIDAPEKRKPGRPRKVVIGVVTPAMVPAEEANNREGDTNVKPVQEAQARADEVHPGNGDGSVPADASRVEAQEHPAQAASPAVTPIDRLEAEALSPEERGAGTGREIAPIEPVMTTEDVCALPPLSSGQQHVKLVADEPEEARLTDAQVIALDRDFDGDAGGSRPHAYLTDIQRKAYLDDIWEAFQGQSDAMREDGFNRLWTFRYEIVRNHAHFLIRVKRGPTVAERVILTSIFSLEAAENAIREIDAETLR